MRSAIEPGNASTKQRHSQETELEVSPVNVGNF